MSDGSVVDAGDDTPDDVFEAATGAVLEAVRGIEAVAPPTDPGQETLRLKAAALAWCRDAWAYGGPHEEELDIREDGLVCWLIEGLTGKPALALMTAGSTLTT